MGVDARHKARHDVPGLQKADTATEVCSLDSRAALAFGDRFAGTTSANFEARTRGGGFCSAISYL